MMSLRFRDPQYGIQYSDLKKKKNREERGKSEVGLRWKDGEDTVLGFKKQVTEIWCVILNYIKRNCLFFKDTQLHWKQSEMITP